MWDSCYRCLPIAVKSWRCVTSIPGNARQFAAAFAEHEGLTAGNLAQFLEKVVEYSDGNPGAMLHMIRLASSPKYAHENQIKIAPLYIDYKIAMVNP